MRIKVLLALYLFIISLIILRLGYWQIIRSEDMIALAEKQRIYSREVSAPRGKIHFSDGSTLVSNRPDFLIYLEPKKIKEKESTIRILAKVLHEDISKRDEENSQALEDIEDSLEKLVLKDLFWVSTGYKVDSDLKQKIEKLNLVGVGFEQSQARFYPESSSSAHLLGFIGSDIYGNDTGYFGLEGYYNGELKGKEGRLKQEKDALGLPILIGNFFIKQPKPGKDLILNIDRTIQHIVEEELKKGVQKYGAKGVSAIIMDPKTGAVLAMASLPSYDPANPSAFPKESFKNPLIADSYEPGSTFKVLVMAAALNERLVDKNTVCDICSGPLNIGGFTIRTWNNRYRKNITTTETIIHSDNIGMVFVAKKLGVDKLYEYIDRFGFGSLTNIDLQDEQTPSIRAKKQWKEIDLATASFGQGIAVSGMQMVKAVAALANGGKIMEPHIVKAVIDEKGSHEIKPRELGQPISQEVAQEIKEMMVKAVDFGEAKFAKPKGYRIAGKTGTAQIPVAGHYDPEKTIASFIGFAPADDPKFIMLVRFVEPSSSIFGSETAAPTFFEIARDILIYLNIAPEE